MLKIGKADDVALRVKDLQVGSPAVLRVALLCSGGLAEEGALHRRFAEHRRHGEWFVADAILSECAAWTEETRVCQACGHERDRHAQRFCRARIERFRAVYGRALQERHQYRCLYRSENGRACRTQVRGALFCAQHARPHTPSEQELDWEYGGPRAVERAAEDKLWVDRREAKYRAIEEYNAAEQIAWDARRHADQRAREQETLDAQVRLAARQAVGQ